MNLDGFLLEAVGERGTEEDIFLDELELFTVPCLDYALLGASKY